MPAGNLDIAAAFDRTADLLEAHQAAHFRVRAYREGAASLRELDREVAAILAEQGHAGLVALPRIGRRLAGVIEDILRNGRFRQLDRLTGMLTPEELFASLPGVGPKLAERLHAELGAESLEELELAAHDGRLGRVRGFGPRRARLLRDVLDATLRRSTRRSARLVGDDGRAREPKEIARPPIAMLLAVDDEYRRRVEEDSLPKIAPRRFNPDAAAWLPILHAQRGEWDFDAMFSNTARAHALGRTRDWVVIFYARDGDEGQCTVVTEYRGPQTGQRVVRGREHEVVDAPASAAEVAEWAPRDA